MSTPRKKARPRYVYLATYADYDDHQVYGAFFTKKAAERLCKTLNETGNTWQRGNFEVETIRTGRAL